MKSKRKTRRRGGAWWNYSSKGINVNKTCHHEYKDYIANWNDLPFNPEFTYPSISSHKLYGSTPQLAKNVGIHREKCNIENPHKLCEVEYEDFYNNWTDKRMFRPDYTYPDELLITTYGLTPQLATDSGIYRAPCNDPPDYIKEMSTIQPQKKYIPTHKFLTKKYKPNMDVIPDDEPNN